MKEDEISESLGLTEIKDRDWGIFKTSAIKGEGLEDAFSWIVKVLSEKK